MEAFELSNFRARRTRVATYLDTLNRISTDLLAESIGRELASTKLDMMEDSFKLVVIGEFSRGKSTVINALLGAKILPSSVEPTTTVLTKIVGAPWESFTVSYRDDAPDQAITAEQFKDLTAPVSPSRKNATELQRYEERLMELRRISVVRITFPSAICSEGVEIVDTPGTNDLDPIREQITYDFVPRADAIIFVLSARQALTQSELSFLTNRVLKADVGRIFFLLNHADTLSEQDLETVRAKCLADLGTVIPHPRLYPVSARQALRTRTGNQEPTGNAALGLGFSHFEKQLAEFLESERSNMKLIRPLSRALRICNELTRGPLAAARSSIGLELPELERRVQEIRATIVEIQQRRAESLDSLRIRFGNRRRELEFQMEKGLREISNVAIRAVDTYTGPLKMEEIRNHIELSVGPVQSKFHTDIRSSVQAAIVDELASVEPELKSFDTDLDAAFRSENDARTLGQDFQFDDSELGKGGAAILQLAAGGLGLLILPLFAPLAILAGWFGGLFAVDWLGSRLREEQIGEVRNAVDERYRGTIPETLASFRSSWDETINRGLARLNDAFDRRCSDAEGILQSVLERFRNANQTAMEMRAELDSLEARLLEVRRFLSAEMQCQ